MDIKNNPGYSGFPAQALAEAQSIKEDLDLLRQDLHRHPELGNAEHYTSALLENRLRALGLDVKRILGTALVATLHGTGPGRNAQKPAAVALRADMDALPITEATGCSFSSENAGVMHACGHDIHMTAAVGTAAILSKHAGLLNGDVVFLFQPDEEGAGGALRMIDEGALEGVGAVFGGHVNPEIPLGKIGIKYGAFYAASDVVSVTVHGKAAHSSTPEKGADALLAAAEMVTLLCDLRPSSGDPAVLRFGEFRSGNVCNVIADTAYFSGIARTFGQQNVSDMRRKIVQTIAGICSLKNVTADIDIGKSYGGVVNREAETRLFEECARSVMGSENVVVIQEPKMGTEDFGYFIDACDAGSFLSIGTGTGTGQSVHTPDFLPDIDAAVCASAVYSATLVEYLNSLFVKNTGAK